MEEIITTQEHISLSREAAAEGMVLIENNGALPLKSEEKIAMFGCGQIRFVKGGEGSGDVNTLYIRSLLEGMQIKESENKVQLYQPLIDSYTTFTAGNQNDEMTLSAQVVSQAAEYASTALVTITRNSGEGWDRNSGRGDYLLSYSEEDMLQKVMAGGFDRVVIVLNIGGVIDTSWIAHYKPDAVLIAWQPGMEGGLAAADILCGDVNPSGKLADTFARSYDDYPSSQTWSESGENKFINHTDDIFVGYRYFETIPNARNRVLYPFGYGLSYTNFVLSNVNVREENDEIVVSVDVKNNGKVAGKEVVQVYFGAPQRNDTTVFLDKASKELAAFAKTKLLKSGETQTLTLKYKISDMASYDDIGKTGKKSAYVLEAGDYPIYVGNSVRDARNVRYTYKINSLLVTEQLTETLTAYQLAERMNAKGEFESTNFVPVHEIKTDESKKIEAKMFNRGSKDIRLERYNDSGNPVQCLAGLSGTGSFLEFDLDVQTAGNYWARLRMSNGHKNIDDAFNIYINGVLQDIAVPLPLVGSGEWYNFVNLAPFTISLPQGKCTVRFEVKSDTCGNWESLIFEHKEEKEQFISANSKSLIEFEDFSDKHPQVKTENFDVDGVSGTCIKDMGNNENRFVSYKLRVEKEGSFEGIIHAANGFGDINNLLQIYVDGQLQPDIVIDVPNTSVSGNDWFNFVPITPFTIELPAGAHEIKFVSTGDSANLDYFTLEPISDSQHVITADSITKIEAVEYSSAHPGVNVELAGDGSGLYFLSGLGGVGKYFTYDLRVEEAGQYNMILSYASAWQDLNNVLKVYVDDVEQTGFTLNMPGSGGWFTLRNMPAVTINLPKGSCKLKFVVNGDPCGNVQHLNLEKSGSAPFTINSAQNKIMAASSAITLLDVYNNADLMDDFLAQMSIKDLSDIASGQTSVIRWNTGGFGNKAEYGIPNAQMLDGPAGIHTSQKTTAWPVAILLACTWNVDILERVGAASAKEGIAAGADIWLAPALNIHRNILCGRNFEYFSEDPLVSGKMSAAITIGVQKNGMGVAVKHFAANNKESNRNDIDSRISERALREIYLKGFEITVKESDPWTIMSSYNFLNGEETAERYDLLTTVLRQEWGFDGLVMTDWGNNSYFWKEIKAGNNLKMPSGSSNELVDACNKGRLTREDLENNAAEILNIIMKTNAFKERAISPKYAPVRATGTTRVIATDFSWISSGIRTEDCNDPAESWQLLGSLNTGEWASYNIDVKEDGDYQLKYRLASVGGGSFDIYLDNEKIGSFSNTVNTGGWQNFATSAAVSIPLTKGNHSLKFVVTGSGMNLRWFELTSPHSVTWETVKNQIDDLPDLYSLSTQNEKEIDLVKSDYESLSTIDKNKVDNINKLDDLVRDLAILKAPPTGDVNIDGAAGIADIMLIRDYILSSDKERLLTAAQLHNADANNDSAINLKDIMRIRKMILA